MIRLALLLLMAASACAQTNWKGIEFLLGNWKSGPGAFSFQPELSGKIVVRHNSNGASHEDLMVIYRDGPGGAMYAINWDTEGHVIRYAISTPSPDRVVFESEGGGPK